MIKINMTRLAHEFETETCSRCGGRGRYSWCQMYGDICFKCHGKGKHYSKRGHVAHDLFEQLLSKPASQIVPGDKIFEYAGLSGKRTFQTVLTIGPTTCQYLAVENGVEIHKTSDGVDIETKQCTYGAVPLDKMYRVAASFGKKRVALRVACKFQASLNKSGKSRKSSVL